MNASTMVSLIILITLAETVSIRALSKSKKISRYQAALLTFIFAVGLGVGAWSAVGLVMGVMAAGPLGIFGVFLFIQLQVWALILIVLSSTFCVLFLKIEDEILAKRDGRKYHLFPWLSLALLMFVPIWLVSYYGPALNRFTDPSHRELDDTIKPEQIVVLSTVIETDHGKPMIRLRVKNNSNVWLGNLTAELTINECKAAVCASKLFPKMSFVGKSNIKECPKMQIRPYSEGNLIAKQSLDDKFDPDETFEVLTLKILAALPGDNRCSE